MQFDLQMNDEHILDRCVKACQTRLAIFYQSILAELFCLLVGKR